MLLLEDNPTDIFVIVELLEASGLNLQPHIVGDGWDALVYLQDLSRNPLSPCPSLVLLDLNLPKVDGLEVLRRLRWESRCKQTPVIVVTSSVADADRTAAYKLGVEAYFEKPNDLMAYKELANVIRRVLRAPEESEGG